MKRKKKQGQKKDTWLSIASFIVDKRRIITLLFVVEAVYCAFSINKVSINQDITAYLPADSETRQGLKLTTEEFEESNVASVMISNVTYDEAASLAERIQKIDNVMMVTYDNTEAYYKGTNALLSVTITGGAEDEATIAAVDEIRDVLEGYDAYVSTTIGSTREMQDMLAEEMLSILIWAIVVAVTVMLIATKSYMIIPVLALTFGVAAVLNMGTNYWFGEISFVTNSVAVVLQLALSIDYAIILSDRFMEEYEHMDAVSAAKVSLSKAIPEISSSSLTTVSGMVAMMLMQFRLGYDMGIVLVKAILFSLITVFLLMPGILVAFAEKIVKTQHKSLVPDISFLGRFAFKTRKIIPPLFIAAVVLGFIGTSTCTYLYDTNSVDGSKKSESTIAREAVEEVFGASNQLVIMVPKGDYASEKKVLEQVAQVDGVTTALGLANQEITDGVTLTDDMTPRQFAELTDMDLELIEAVYALYAYDQEDYGPLVTNIDSYGVPMIDMFLFLYDQYQERYITLDEEMDEMLNMLYDTLSAAKDQLEGEHYVRFILNLDLPTEGQETYDTMEEIRDIAETYYGEDNVILVGNSTSTKDLQDAFATDNLVISIMTALFVFVVLLFTFWNVGLSALLVVTIQGCIWINFAIPSFMGEGVYFIGYLIVSAIQMGATIDYAIVIGNRYMQLRKEMEPKEAIQLALNQSFPTVFTSGTIMTAAGFLVGYMTSDVTISVFGICMGRGALISVLVVLLVLPQLLLVGDKLIRKTQFSFDWKRLLSSPPREDAAGLPEGAAAEMSAPAGDGAEQTVEWVETPEEKKKREKKEKKREAKKEEKLEKKEKRKLKKQEKREKKTDEKEEERGGADHENA